MKLSQPHRIEWTIPPTTLEDCSAQLATQFAAVDQMFQILFDNLKRPSDTSRSQALLRTFLRG